MRAPYATDPPRPARAPASPVGWLAVRPEARPEVPEPPLPYPGLRPAPSVEPAGWHPADRRGFARWSLISAVLAVFAGVATGVAARLADTAGPWPGVLAMVGWGLLAMALWWTFDVYGPR